MLSDDFFPPPQMWLDLSKAEQLTDGRARCTAVAVCDEAGRPCQKFHQGQEAHFFYEFEVLDQIDVPAGGLEFHNETGLIIHGKNTFQYGSPAPHSAEAGARLRYHHILRLDVGPGNYGFTVGLASVNEEIYTGYVNGPLTHNDLQQAVREHCRVRSVGTFNVQLDRMGKLRHHGLADLPGNCTVQLQQPDPITALGRKDTVVATPTIFHITHWKAGSQWINKILAQCAPDLIVPPQVEETQFLNWPIQLGKIYPTVYVSKPQFDSVQLPSQWRRFIVVRDLRDTLISAYFSLKISHVIVDQSLTQIRSVLQSSSMEDGLIYLIDTWLPRCALIQKSWLEVGERLIRYEDLLERDIEILERVLLEECQLPVSYKRFNEVVKANRFERLTRGRPRGQEDDREHQRKGIAGDWRNYFTDNVKRIFKEHYSGLLVAMGYEANGDWE